MLRSTLRALRGRYRRVRFALWVRETRLAMWRAGGRLVVEAPHGCRWGSPPRITALRDGPLARGTLTLRIGRDVSLGRGLKLEVFALGENLLELKDNSYLLDDVHIALRDGSVRLGARTRVANYAIMLSRGEISVGDDVSISHMCILHCDERIALGDHSGLAERVTVVDSEHGFDGTDTPFMHNPITKRPVVLAENVFVGTNATVTKGTTVGPNAVIAAGAVLNGKEYPGGWVIGGVPAKAIRRLAPAEASQPRR